MNIKQEKVFSPVTITLESKEEVWHLYANLIGPMESLNAAARSFAYQLSELIYKETNVFDRKAP